MMSLPLIFSSDLMLFFLSSLIVFEEGHIHQLYFHCHLLRLWSFQIFLWPRVLQVQFMLSLLGLLYVRGENHNGELSSGLNMSIILFHLIKLLCNANVIQNLRSLYLLPCWLLSLILLTIFLSFFFLFLKNLLFPFPFQYYCSFFAVFIYSWHL